MSKVYCDESGFTGSKLLDKDQPFFIYGAIELEYNEAIAIVNALKKSSHISDVQELKYKTLGKNKEKLVQEIINNYKDKIFINISHKPYVLSSWFCFHITTLFANIYLPMPMVFSNYIYSNHFDVVEEFYKYFISLNADNVKEFDKHKCFLISCINKISENIPNIKNLISYITTEEMDFSIENKFIFDISVSSINTTIKNYKSENTNLLFYCDNSKPLYKFLQIPSEGVDKYAQELKFFKNKIRLGDSSQCNGLQIIDTIVSYFFTQLKQKEIYTWTEILSYTHNIGIQGHIHAVTSFQENKDIIIGNFFDSYEQHYRLDIGVDNPKISRIVDKFTLIENDKDVMKILNKFFGEL